VASQPRDEAAAGKPGRRMTLSNVLELLLERKGGEHSSVTLTRNAKGETQIDVCVRTAELGDVQTVDSAYDKAIELYDKARSRYPMSAGNTGGSS
jgi:hypothetical protein